jgi:hypothetical protein
MHSFLAKIQKLSTSKLSKPSDIGRYLTGTKHQDIICTITNDGLECCSDADCAGNWNKDIATNDDTTARSQTGYIIRYAGCPLIWGSKWQTEIALSSSESEYIALSQSLREVIYIIDLIKEMTASGFQLNTNNTAAKCNAFEDNKGSLEMDTIHKLRPRTNYINVKYHHFCSAVLQEIISKHKIATEDQFADIFTKPLAVLLFVKLRRLIMGW